jgi:hypothetical protein
MPLHTSACSVDQLQEIRRRFLGVLMTPGRRDCAAVLGADIRGDQLTKQSVIALVNATLTNFNLNGISTANLTQVNVAVETLGCLGQMISQFAANGSQVMDPVLRNYTAYINQGISYINSGRLE